MSTTELFEEIQTLYSIADRIDDKETRKQLYKVIEDYIKKWLLSEEC
jgi:hypothetical protein